MRRKKKHLLLLLLILGIGFASIATTLYINGNAIISSNNSDFDVKFTKAIRGEEDISSTSMSADAWNERYDSWFVDTNVAYKANVGYERALRAVVEINK